MWTGQADTAKLIVAFRSCANALQYDCPLEARSPVFVESVSVPQYQIVAFRVQWCHSWQLCRVSQTGIASTLQDLQVGYYRWLRASWYCRSDVMQNGKHYKRIPFYVDCWPQKRKLLVMSGKPSLFILRRNKIKNETNVGAVRSCWA